MTEPASDTTATTGTAEVAERYRRLASALSATVGAVPEERWASPSPCAEWSALDVLGHVATTEREFLGRFDVTADRVPVSHDDPRRDWPVVRDAVQGVLDDPTLASHQYDGVFGTTTVAATVDTFYAMDLVVHRWDIARATGLVEHEAMDEAEVARITASARRLGDALRSPGVCAAEVPPPPDATDQDRLLAYLGRQP